MNISQRGQLAQGGVIMPSYTELIPEAKIIYTNIEAKQEAYAKAFVRVAASQKCAVYQTGIPTWEALTDDSVKLSALQELNMTMLIERARINKERALRTRQEELIERTRAINQAAQQTVQIVPTAPQLLRTVSRPFNEGLRLIGKPPVNPSQEAVRVTASRTLIIPPGQDNQAIRTILKYREEAKKSLQEQAAKTPNSPQGEARNQARQSPQPGTSTQVMTGLIKPPGSPNQELQGKTTQSFTLNEIFTDYLEKNNILFV